MWGLRGHHPTVAAPECPAASASFPAFLRASCKPCRSVHRNLGEAASPTGKASGEPRKTRCCRDLGSRSLGRPPSTFVLGDPHSQLDSHSGVWMVLSRPMVLGLGVATGKAPKQWCRWLLAQMPTEGQPDLHPSPTSLEELSLGCPHPHPYMKAHLLICTEVRSLSFSES